MKKITLGCQVAFNTLPDAVWFTVVKIEGFRLTVREHPDHADQCTDKSLVKQVRA